MLERFEGRWSKLDRLNRLKKDGAISEEEFGIEKARLLAKGAGKSPDDPEKPRRLPPGAVLALSILGLLVVAGLVAVVFQNNSLTTGSYMPTTADVTTSASSAAAANLTASKGPEIMPAEFSPDQVATAAALVYAGKATEIDSNGSRMEFTPARLVPVEKSTLALISTGLRDGGSSGTGCHACSGELRVDYLLWNGGAFEVPVGHVRYDDDAKTEWGQPPEWRFAKTTGLPTIVMTSLGVGGDCVVKDVIRIKLTPAGVAPAGSKRTSDCVGVLPANIQGGDVSQSEVGKRDPRTTPQDPVSALLGQPPR